MARTAKTSLAIYDEGIYIGDATSLDFTGAGISGSYNSTTGRATETVTGGGGGGTQVYNEIVSGSGTSFTLAHVPLTGTLELYGGGSRLYPTLDYTLAGAAITMVNSYDTGQVLADYAY